MKSATACAYSSSANLGPGFDTMGLAHDACRNSVTVALAGDSGRIELDLDCGNLPTNPFENTASLAIRNMLESRGITGKFRISIRDGIPVGLGLGCSGASAAAGVEALDILLDLGLTQDEKVHFAMTGETASSGTPHADNVAASIYGGLVAVQSLEPMKVRPLKVSSRFSFLTIVPHIRINSKTRLSRSLVPKNIPMAEHIGEIRHMGLMLAGFLNGDSDLLRSGMNDGIVEKARMQLFPFYPEIKEMALGNNAAGACVSGAGPSILMVVDNSTDVDGIMEGSRRILAKSGVDFSVYRSKPAGGAHAEED